MPVKDAGPDLTKKADLYGSAFLREEGPQDITATFDPKGSIAIPLGHNTYDRNMGSMYVLGPSGDKGHALTFGATRSGKGVSAIIPALLTYKGSVVVIDPKGENAWITAKRRREMGQRVVIIDPWDEVNKRYGKKVGDPEIITRFNPLSALDPDNPDFADEVTSIAEAFILQTSADPHWPDSARELVGGIIAAEVERNPGTASMRDVRKMIRNPIQALRASVEKIVATTPNSVAAGKLAAFVEKDEKGDATSTKEMSAIRSTARTQTGFLDSRRLLDAMDSDDPPFNLEELANCNTTLYLVLPVDRLQTHGRWLRMILTLAIRAISRQDTPPEIPVLMVLDELGTISPGSGLAMIEQSFGLMAGLGIRIWGFLQDLPQLKRDYPASWETFVSNSSLVQLLNVADSTTAEYFARYIGDGTLEVDHGFRQAVRPDKYTGTFTEHMSNVSIAMQQSSGAGIPGAKALGRKETWEAEKEYHRRPVLYPWELRASATDKSILIFPGAGVLRLPRFTYYSDPILGRWARPDPNKLAPKVEPLPTRPTASATAAERMNTQFDPSSMLPYLWMVLATLAAFFAYQGFTSFHGGPMYFLAVLLAFGAYFTKRKFNG